MNLSEKIDQYIDGLLNEEEAREFEQLIKFDPILEQQVEEIKIINTILSESLRYKTTEFDARDILENDLILPDRLQELEIDDDLYRYHYNYRNPNTLDKEKEVLNAVKLLRENKKKVTISLISILKIAASIVIILFLATGIFKAKEQLILIKLSSDIFQREFHPENDAELTNLISADGYNTYSELKNNSNNIYPEIFRSNSENKNKYLFAGIISLHQNNPEIAVMYLNINLNNPDEGISDIVNWYYALSLLKQHKTSEAIKYLSLLCDSDSAYRDKSCAIVESLLGS
jgi:hypothetical protein